MKRMNENVNHEKEREACRGVPQYDGYLLYLSLHDLLVYTVYNDEDSFFRYVPVS